MKLHIIIVFLLFLSTLPLCTQELPDPPFEDPSSYKKFDVNRIDFWIADDGQIGQHPDRNDSGTFYTHGLREKIIFASGFFLTGFVHGSRRDAYVFNYSEYTPGPVNRNGMPDSLFRVYKINRDGSGDWDAWPFELGAPSLKSEDGHDSLDVHGRKIPQLFGDQTLWLISNDLDVDKQYDASKHVAEVLGVELQTTIFGFREYENENIVFFNYKFINKNNVEISNCYFMIYSDIDIGRAGDDFFGCDTLLDLGYGYQKSSDEYWGNAPPAVGWQLLQGPRVAAPGEYAAAFGRMWQDSKNLRATAFLILPRFWGPFDPNPELVLEFAQGRSWGGPTINPLTGDTTTFQFSGDPVLSTGYLDHFYGYDGCIQLSTGPFAIAAGDSQEIIIANLVGAGVTPLHSVLELRHEALKAKKLYNDNFQIQRIDSSTINFPTDYAISNAYPNPFNAETRIKIEIPRDCSASAKIYGLRGRHVKTLFDGAQGKGVYDLSWNGRDDSGKTVSSGVYFVRFNAPGVRGVRKLTLVR
jgi:hypothetical protein